VKLVALSFLPTLQPSTPLSKHGGRSEGLVVAVDWERGWLQRAAREYSDEESWRRDGK
jgi:hypothetical protein